MPEISLLSLSQQVLNGLTLGAIYALIALGYTMVYGILLMVNFAHSEIFMLGAVAGWIGLSALPASSGPAALVLTFFFAMLVSGALGVLLDIVAYAPLRKSPRLTPLI